MLNCTLFGSENANYGFANHLLNERPSVQDKPQRLVGQDLALQRLLEFRQRADGAEEAVHVVDAFVSRPVQMEPPVEIRFGETLQTVADIIETMGRLAGGARQAEDPVDFRKSRPASELAFA